MPLPVIAITNASTVLSDAQVEAVLPALQKQVSNDFKTYWELDCTLQFLPRPASDRRMVADNHHRQS